MFGVSPASTSGFIWRGRGEAWEQSNGYSWEWTGVHDQHHKDCDPEDPDPKDPCKIPDEIDIEKKKNLARSCIVSVDNDYYYSKSAAGLFSKLYRESI